MHPQHPGTRPRRGDDIIIAGKGIEYLQGNRLGIGPVTGVVSGLAATGLSTRYLHRTSRVFEEFDSRKPDCRAKQIDQTGDKQRYTHSTRPVVIGSKQAYRS